MYTIHVLLKLEQKQNYVFFKEYYLLLDCCLQDSFWDSSRESGDSILTSIVHCSIFDFAFMGKVAAGLFGPGSEEKNEH